jgi:hypothetical protein
MAMLSIKKPQSSANVTKANFVTDSSDWASLIDFQHNYMIANEFAKYLSRLYNDSNRTAK